MNVEMNIGFSIKDDWQGKNDERILSLTELILKGRKLNGDPEDLNF